MAAAPALPPGAPILPPCAPALPPGAPTLPPAVARFSTVDVLRGFAILAVVLLHTALRFGFSGYPIRHLLPRNVNHLLFQNGDHGVTVFFTVSGFLITLTSLRRFGSLASMRPATFYRIRFARIAPLLVTVVAVLTVLALMHVEGFQFSRRMVSLPRAILAVFTFHSNWLEARYGYLPANWNVLWSLSVEEMFYLFFPLVCLLCLRFRHGLSLFIAVLAGFVVEGPFARHFAFNGTWQDQSYLGGMDAIAMGCMAALLTEHLLTRQRLTGSAAARHRTLLLALQTLGAALLVYIAYEPHNSVNTFLERRDLMESLIPLGTCAIMVASVLRGSSQAVGSVLLRRITAPIRWYGRHSYELYLTHEFLVVFVVEWYLRRHPNLNANQDLPSPVQPTVAHLALWFVLILVLTVPVASLLSRGLSEPLNRRLRGARPPA